MRAAPRRALALGLLCATLACAKGNEDSEPPKEAEPTLLVHLYGDEDSNNGHALQVVIRAVEEKDFIEDSYSDIAVLVSNPDDSVLGVVTVFPGQPSEAPLFLAELPPFIGVYGLFNDTKNSDWKLLIETGQPAGAAAVADPNAGSAAYLLEIASGYGSLRDLSDPEQDPPSESATSSTDAAS